MNDHAFDRVFIFGAGFSSPAKMPLANELVDLLLKKHNCDEMREYLTEIAEVVGWLEETSGSSKILNIEHLFDIAQCDVEFHRIMQQLCQAGRSDGPATPWNRAESVLAWLQYLEESLRDVISECDILADLSPIRRWAKTTRASDVVLTFNYDTLAEKALGLEARPWSHGFETESSEGIPVLKLHGSIDWIVASSTERDSLDKLELLFEKRNLNHIDRPSGDLEEDSALFRFANDDQRALWMKGRALQGVPKGAFFREVGIAGLGTYKPLHRVPGLGQTWTSAIRALQVCKEVLIVGFSMSQYDVMAQLHFARVAMSWRAGDRSPNVKVIAPVADEQTRRRFKRVFHRAEFLEMKHEDFDWEA